MANTTVTHKTTGPGPDGKVTADEINDMVEAINSKRDATDAGPAGAQGPAGAVGAQGPAGPAGAQGPAGAVGAQGPAGPAGAQGPAGAVGAQGPAGPAGAQGLDGMVGAQGPAGAVGAQGPAGVQGPSGGGSGYVARPFDQTLIFDSPFKMAETQTGNIAFFLGDGPIADVIARVTIIGDGLHACTFPNAWVNANGQIFDNRFKNIVFLEYDGDEVLYSIVKSVTLDTVPPVLASAVINNANKNKIILTYNELLDELSIPAIGDFTANLGKAVSSITIAGSIATLTMASNYANGDAPTVSYTTGGNPIQDLAGNHAAALVNQVIVNNVAAARQSGYATIANQIQQTAVVPTVLAWGAGGADRPWSMSAWIKRNGNNRNYLMELLSDSNPSTPDLGVLISSTGEVEVYIYNGGTLYAKSPASIQSDTWTHVTVTYDGSAAFAGVKIYINKVLQASSDLSSGSYAPLTSLATDFQLAVLGRAYDTGQGTLINTKVCSMYFWNKELTASDLNEIYNGGTLVDPTALSMAANLKSQFEFDGNANDTGVDAYNLSGINPLTYVTDTP